MTSPLDAELLANSSGGGWSSNPENSITLGLTPGNEIIIGEDIPPELAFFTNIDGQDFNTLAAIIYEMGGTTDYHFEAVGYFNGDPTAAVWFQGFTTAGVPTVAEYSLKDSTYPSFTTSISRDTLQNWYDNTSHALKYREEHDASGGAMGISRFIHAPDAHTGAFSSQTSLLDLSTFASDGSPFNEVLGLVWGARASAGTNLITGLGNVSTPLAGAGGTWSNIALPLSGPRRYWCVAEFQIASTVTGDFASLDIRYGPLGTVGDPVVASSGNVHLPLANTAMTARVNKVFSIAATSAVNKLTLSAVRQAGTGVLTVSSGTNGQQGSAMILDAGQKSYWSDANS